MDMNTKPYTSSGSYVAQEYSSFNAGAINTTGELCELGAHKITSSSGQVENKAYQWKLDGVVLSSSNSATFDPQYPMGRDHIQKKQRWKCSSFTSTGTWTVTESCINSGTISSAGESICGGSFRL
ncbi:MAG: hypothetical protein CM15mP65_00410 [Crocinitomicaceae bacterium]|nr:MAG: hypothetical protein CM15mP65_00410 [Crocinitomicaceae bacterium]